MTAPLHRLKEVVGAMTPGIYVPIDPTPDGKATVALRNLADELIAVAEAGGELADAATDVQRDPDSPSGSVFERFENASDAMDAALASLDARIEEVLG